MSWRLANKDELLVRSGGDPYVATEVAPGALGLVGPLGWAVVRPFGAGRAGATLVFDSTPDEPAIARAIELVEGMAAGNGWRLIGITTHEGIELPPGSRWQLGGHWVWMSATQVVADDGRWQLVELDDQADADEINTFALAANPLFEGDPGQGRNRFWLGARDATGALIGCGTVHDTPAGVGHLAGVVVDPARRRQGLGRALVIGLSRAVLATDGVTTLSAYAQNKGAIRLYEQVGYRLDHRFHSRFNEPRRAAVQRDEGVQ